MKKGNVTKLRNGIEISDILLSIQNAPLLYGLV